jgi:hypothetical protein
MAAIVLGAVAGIFYPFLPGPYDAIAAPLSLMLQVASMAALALLTPIGVLWLVHERRGHSARSRGISRANRARMFGVAAVAASFFVVAAGAVFAVNLIGPAIGVLALALWLVAALRSLRAMRTWARDDRADVVPAAPLYLALVPIIVVAARFALMGRAVEWSRSRAIAASAPYIADIETYRATRGHYPQSVGSLNTDYRPGVVGVQRFHYERNGAAYNVYFEQPSSIPDTRVLVAYNPLDQQQMTSHDADILQFTPERLNQTRGYSASHAATEPHWRVFLFD